MRDLNPALRPVVDAIDEANSADPSRYDGRPLAQVQGELATGWLEQLAPDAPAEVVVAARAHHLERWALARADYPEGRAGYLRWRRDNKAHQADRAVELAARHAPDLDGERIRELLLRKGLGTDPGTQLIEDVACLVFAETQFDELTDRLDSDHMVGIVARTLNKMSPSAVALAATVNLSEESSRILAAAVAQSRSDD